MHIHDGVVTIEEIHRIRSLSIHDLYGAVHIILDPGIRNAKYQCHGDKKCKDQSHIYLNERF